ncbi:hypothetical protein ACFWEJ_25035, partial [Promicromonospora sp. NPDC060204]|uniref:hypothetical protein n=1 Tax=Promicromonospora sp. NPDC060204 TaxID=3347071 RepID=UPI003653B723
ATNPATAIEMLAEEVAIEPVDDATLSALRINFPLLDQAIREFAVTLLPGTWGDVASESSIEIHGAVERRSYKVDDARLSNVRVDLTCEMYPPAPAEVPRVTLGLWVYVWIQLSDGEMTVEIESVRERGEN